MLRDDCSGSVRFLVGEQDLLVLNLLMKILVSSFTFLVILWWSFPTAIKPSSVTFLAFYTDALGLSQDCMPIPKNFRSCTKGSHCRLQIDTLDQYPWSTPWSTSQSSSLDQQFVDSRRSVEQLIFSLLSTDCQLRCWRNVDRVSTQVSMECWLNIDTWPQIPILHDPRRVLEATLPPAWGVRPFFLKLRENSILMCATSHFKRKRFQ